MITNKKLILPKTKKEQSKMISNLEQFKSIWEPKINDVLSSKIDEASDQATLAQAMNYSVNAGGKRLRPLLTLATITTLNSPIDVATLKASCAIELLHSYSLIHDDLPAMDDDDLRRGLPTNHVKYGEAMAILAGDGLQALAFQWLLDNNLPDVVKTQLALALAKAAGPSGMVAGQADDIEFSGTTLDILQLQKLHRNKTGKLIHYSVKAGLIMAQVDLAEYQELIDFADLYGLAFQVYDDILDVTGTQEQLGKPTHQDGLKNTYPNLIGLDESYEKLANIRDEALAKLAVISEKHGVDVSLLAAFCDYFKIKGEV